MTSPRLVTRRTWVAQLGVFFLVYFVQKMTGVVKLPLRNTLRLPTLEGGLGMSVPEIGYFFAAVALGWYIKALLGMVSDRIPLFGYRRKTWLAAASLGTSAVWLGVAVSDGWTVESLFAAILAVNLLIAFSDVVCDGLMVEAGRHLEQEEDLPPGTGNRRFQTAQWIGATLAMTIAAVGGGVIAQFFTLRTVAWILVALPLLVVAACVFFVREERTPLRWAEARLGVAAVGLCVMVAAAIVGMKRATAGSPFAAWEPLASVVLATVPVLLVADVPRRVLYPLLLMVLWRCMPFNTDTQYLYQFFSADDPGFRAVLDGDGAFAGGFRRAVEAMGFAAQGGAGYGTVFFGAVLLPVEYLGAMLGLILSWAYLRNAPMSRVLKWCLGGWAGVLVVFVGLALGGSRSLPCVLAAFALVGVVSILYNTAILFYAASHTAARNAATVFAMLLGFSNIGVTLGGEAFGGWLYSRGGAASAFPEGTSPASAGLLLVLGVAAVHTVLLYVFIAATFRDEPVRGGP